MNAPILFVHGISAIGGAERELLVILDRLHRQRFRVAVVCHEGGAFAQEVGRRGIPIRSSPFPPWRKWQAYVWRSWACRRLRDVIHSERPALIHVNDIWWVPQTLQAAEGVNIPVVGHVRQEIQPYKVKQYGLERLDMALAVSHQIRRSLLDGGVAPDRAQTLYSGLDLRRVTARESRDEVRRRLGIPSNAVLSGTVANLFPRKGYEVMLRALQAILAVVPNVHYLIVGTGAARYEKSLRLCAQSLGITGHVHFAGFQETVYSYLGALDLYVQPSLMEGLGIAVIEAMAMGKPVVATATGGLPEVVLDGETGLLVPPGDSDALAGAVMQILQHPGWREDFGKVGRKRVEGLFTVDKMMDQLMLAYQAVLGRHSVNGQSIAT